MGGRRRPESAWLGLVAEWRASGLSLYRFAKGRGIPPNSLAHWVNRGAAPVRLLRVDVKEPVIEAPTVASVEIHVRGAVLRMATDVPALWVAELIRHAGDA